MSDENDIHIRCRLRTQRRISTKQPTVCYSFRGTYLKQETWEQDIKLDTLCLVNRPHKSSRFQHAMNYVRNMVTSSRGASVWLAGHSLGAAMALLAGKEMAKEGHLIEIYLFNPPFCSDLIAKWIQNDIVRFENHLSTVVES
ncbi:gdsl esterase/lipase [Quercus suber]|uniref:Gdsl esterase/lipase n=1 Tax=Quercus suber TaxID=58331 RepID=A0AAW0LDI9_QUESU